MKPALLYSAISIAAVSALAYSFPSHSSHTKKASPKVQQPAHAAGEWASYASDPHSSKYSPLTQIDRTNFKNLKVAWRWSSPDNDKMAKTPGLGAGPNESTPLMVNGTLYMVTNLNQVCAIDPSTGKTIWTFDPGCNGNVHRGLAYWRNLEGDDERLILASKNAYLYSINPKTGKPVESFGNKGRIDLTQGLRVPVDRNLVTYTSPPAVCGDVIIVGGSVDDFQDKKEMPPGDVRGFDARSGRLIWTFHTIPQKGEPGNETWKEDSWKYTGAANVWTWMSVDPELGYVYLPIATPNMDWYGGHRPGEGLYGESVVCLDAATGRKVWHYQLVHHGLWDYDLPCAPVLLDVNMGGKQRKLIAQVTKQAFCFVFDRVTGKPVWPIVEKPAPKTIMAGDTASATQPIPTKPKPFDIQGSYDKDLCQFTPALHAEAKKLLAKYRHGPLYTPPSNQSTIEMPGWVGGASWAGASGDPETGILYVPSVTNPMFMTLKKPERQGASLNWMPGESGHDIPGPKGLPLFKPPYGRITAIDLKTGDHKWMTPHGDGPVNHPALKGLKLPKLGDNRRGYLIVTKTLLISIKEGAWFNDTKPDYPPKLRAFDKATGKLLAEVALPAPATGAPMTFMHQGKQYIAYSTGGGGAKTPLELIALRLP